MRHLYSVGPAEDLSGLMQLLLTLRKLKANKIMKNVPLHL